MTATNNTITVEDINIPFYPQDSKGEYSPVQDIARLVLAFKKMFMDSTQTNSLSLANFAILIEKLDDCSDHLISYITCMERVLEHHGYEINSPIDGSTKTKVTTIK